MIAHHTLHTDTKRLHKAKFETEVKLVASARSGDNKAASILFQQCSLLGFRLLGRYNFPYEDKQDLIQDVFLKTLTLFDGGGKNVACFTSYFGKILNNRAIDVFRARKNRPVTCLTPTNYHPLCWSDEIESNMLTSFRHFLTAGDYKFLVPLLDHCIKESSSLSVPAFRTLPLPLKRFGRRKAEKKIKQLAVEFCQAVLVTR